MTKSFNSFLAFLGCFLILFLRADGLARAGGAKTEKPTPDKVLQLLAEGNQRFHTGKPIYPHTGAARCKQAGSEDQAEHAIATVLACSDSRVPVELIFDTGVMDIFTVRVAGNVCDTDEIGSIEYGLAHVHTPVFVMLGHTQCGAVTAVTHALQGHGKPLERNIPQLVDNIIPAVRKAMAAHTDLQDDALIPHAIRENVWQGIEDLFMKSPVTRQLVKAGSVKVVGAIYDVASGKVTWLPAERVALILDRVEASSEKETEVFAAY
jgi:carbonic anhydrase